jgi:carbon-monoxide dehydrogenase medium subunit
MVPAPFEYFRPQSVEEAIALLSQHEDAKVLAGGHSLIPAMKFRLAQPKAIIDITSIAGLSYVRESGGKIAIGAMTTHFEIESSALLKEKCPLLPEVACCIGDVQVRNKGTLGGSIVHADPAADWPAPILALDAEMEIAAANGRRTVKATEFFVEMMQSAVQSNEILVEIRVPTTLRSVAYEKSAQKASGFAIAGVAAVIGTRGKGARVGISGVAAKPYRATAVESALEGKELTVASIREAADKAADGAEPLNDIHASAEFRAHLAEIHTRRALEWALSRQS